MFFIFFFTLFICEMHVLLCACLQVCLWGFPVLVPVCSFPFSPFASFVCFLLGIKGPYLCPVCPPRQHCARLYLLLWCVFFRVLCMHGMTDFSSTTTICAPATLISVANHALMRHYWHWHPSRPTIDTHCHPQPTMLGMPCCCSFWQMLLCTVYCACSHALCVCLRVLGCFPFAHVLILTLKPYAYVVATVLAFDNLVR